MSYVTKIEGVEIDLRRVNDALWAGCNMQWGSVVPTIERASEAAMRALAAYHGVSYEAILDAYNTAYGRSVTHP